MHLALLDNFILFGLEKSSSSYSTQIKIMFSILPLQLATNIFIAETTEDLDKFYGFDKITKHYNTPKPPMKSFSFSLPEELVPRRNTSIVDLEVKSKDNKYLIKDIPPDIKDIVIYENSDKIEPIGPGQLCLVTPNKGHPRAFYRVVTSQNSELE